MFDLIVVNQSTPIFLDKAPTCRESVNSEIKPPLAFGFLFLFMQQKMVNITLHCASSNTEIEGRMQVGGSTRSSPRLLLSESFQDSSLSCWYTSIPNKYSVMLSNLFRFHTQNRLQLVEFKFFNSAMCISQEFQRSHANESLSCIESAFVCLFI